MRLDELEKIVNGFENYKIETEDKQTNLCLNVGYEGGENWIPIGVISEEMENTVSVWDGEKEIINVCFEYARTEIKDRLESEKRSVKRAVSLSVGHGTEQKGKGKWLKKRKK